jgi:hypothetical protein
LCTPLFDPPQQQQQGQTMPPNMVCQTANKQQSRLPAAGKQDATPGGYKRPLEANIIQPPVSPIVYGVPFLTPSSRIASMEML